MHVEIKVTDPAPDAMTDFAAMTYQHMRVGCGLMRYHTNWATRQGLLLCDCGLQVDFDEEGAEGTVIMMATTDGEAHPLRQGITVCGVDS